jgi:sigma-E factor negative regulatory protein RseA
MVMGEETSLLVDGELEQARLDSVCRALDEPRARQVWDCYHLIGDCLRHADTVRLPRSFADGAFLGRVSDALEEEPTVLAPRPPRAKPAFVAWAVAASVAAVSFVGWFALQDYTGNDGTTTVARVASDAGNAQIRRVSNVKDYVAAHQQFAPAMGMEYTRPYIRSVASSQDPTQ